jgi:hypothetical protein
MAAEGRYAPAGRPPWPSAPMPTAAGQASAPPAGSAPSAPSAPSAYGAPAGYGAPPTSGPVVTGRVVTGPLPAGTLPPGSVSAAPVASSAAADLPVAPGGAPQAGQPQAGQRPVLPRRQGQTHMAPELREGPQSRRDDAPDDQMPGLMAAFQEGISRAAREDTGPPQAGPRPDAPPPTA